MSHIRLPVLQDQSRREATVTKIRGSYDRALFSHPHNIGGPGLLAEMVGLLDTIVADPSRGMDVSVFLGEGVRVAKPVNESLMPVDGTTANFFYRV